MSITSRINEIETHLKEDYTNLEALGYDIPQDKNIENIASVLDNVWENQSHIEETGTTLSMNTNKGKAKVDLLGNTYQETTSISSGDEYDSPSPDHPQPIQVVSGDNEIKVCGKNLFEDEYIGIPMADRTNAYLIAGTYALASCDSNTFGKNIYFRLFDKNTKNIITSSGHLTSSQVPNFSTSSYSYYGGSNASAITFTLDNDYYVNVGLLDSDSTRQVMLVKGSEIVRTYEPYQSASYEIDLKTSKNLFDISTITENTYINEHGTIGTSSVTNLSDYTKINSNSKYTLSYDYETLLNSSQRSVCYYNENKTFISSGVYIPTDKTHAITTPNNAKYIRFSYDKNCYDIQLELGETATTYEAYSSLELNKIGTYQDKFIRTSGKNLLDISTITENTYIEENGNTGSSQVTNLSNYIEIKPNTSYTLSYNYSTLLNSNQRNVIYYDENKTYISGWVYLPINKTTTITTPNNAKYIRFSYDKNHYSIMLNEGTTALPYEPYGNGDWYLKKNINKIILNGTDYPLYGDGGSSNDYWEYSRTGMTGGIGTQDSVKTNYFNQTTNSRIVILSNGGMYFRFPKASGIDVSTNTLLNTWLSTHNTIVDYVLATPTYTKIEGTLASQLEDVWRANTYDNQTNVSQVNNDLPFELYFKALGTPSNTLLGLSRNLQLNNPIENVEEIEEPIEEIEESGE